MNERLQFVKDLPVKIFINCKNSKRKAAPSKINKFKRISEEDHFDPVLAGEEAISRDEVYFTGKENIEGFACLINVFIR